MDKIAYDEVVSSARKILKDNPDLKEFIMGMGIWNFTSKCGYDIDVHNPKDPRFNKLADFINRWDDLKITGIPVRFTATNEAKHTW